MTAAGQARHRRGRHHAVEPLAVRVCMRAADVLLVVGVVAAVLMLVAGWPWRAVAVAGLGAALAVATVGVVAAGVARRRRRRQPGDLR